ncbi:MAG: ABC transporter ATP-binding protein/permease [Oscillospiraceae bacterium]|nr:ABC transporter ATP-binding protein/permease [Oscillospiraceae bacterium]
MRLLFRAMGRYKRTVAISIIVKLFATISELMLPYILEHIIDKVVPLGRLGPVVFWGLLMFAAAILTRQLNVAANRRAVQNAHRVSYDIRQELFRKTANLSGSQFDAFGLPSLISRMTSDSYNVQSAAQQLQTLCVRAPMLLIGGVCVSLVMDASLAMTLVAMLPVLIAVVLAVSAKGLPMYRKVQQKLDVVVRVMRENITGIRVVKALSKTEYEKRRFAQANRDMTDSDIAAGTVMAIPSPFMQLCLNGGLTLVVLFGARRVNAGVMEPGVILAFLTYFNMITMGVMGVSRIFMTLSRAGASADRIDQVLQTEADQRTLSADDALTPAGDEFIRFEHVSFSYGEGSSDAAGFAGEEREKALTDISFALKRGESLGIIGPTGCGKSTIISLLMRFYDVGDGGVFVDGKDVRAYDKDELRRRFGVCFQNDMVFQDTLRENVCFGREVDDAAFRAAIEDAMAAEYIDALEDGPDHQAAIKGANLSGGQKQRLLVARALAACPEILVLDDSSSALDYQTDAAMRRAIGQNHADSTLIMIAQRVSSIMGMTHILVMDNGKCVGYGTHEELLETCPAYRETYQVQMGEMA